MSGITIAVLGTPIDKIYPAENKQLAADICAKGLLLSPSLPHEQRGRYLFPRRNRLMAQLSAATIVIEAGATSGVRHQAAECLRQGRRLFFLKSMLTAENREWVDAFLRSGGELLESAADLKKHLACLA